ncbi:MAG: hypothetical protein OEN00_15910, partial [Gemmatimonadota bacterium]|nr:hypothetical protein [Gemmatimonadota bacterium]
WIFGMDRGWEEITRGADMHVPGVFRFVIRFVTPAFILVVFVGALVEPVGRWGAAVRSLFTGGGWPFSPTSVIGRVAHVGEQEYRWLDETGEFTRSFVQDATRLLLLAVFIACGLLVWKAWRLRAEERA